MKPIQKKAMSQFEIIGYAILAIVVVIVAIVIFTKLTKGPADRVGGLTNAIDKNQEDCVNNPATCNPLKAAALPSSLNLNVVHITELALSSA